MIRLAVVGTNFITDRLLAALPLCGKFTLTAVYSRSLSRAEEYGKAHGASYFYESLTNWRKAPRQTPFAWPAPTRFHAAQAQRL